MCRRAQRAAREAEFIRFLDEEPAPAAKKPEPAADIPPAKGKEKTPREWPVGVLAFVTVVTTGLVLREAWSAGRMQVKVEELGRTFVVEPKSKLVVETFNGPIEVTRGESGRVECRVVKRGSGPDEEAAAADLRNIAVAMTREGDTVRITAHRTASAPSGNSGAEVRVQVPDGTAVRLETRNGAIQVKQVEGPVHARATNGKIQVRGAAGPVELTTTNGGIACEATDAVVTADTTNGGIDFRGSLARGQSALHSTNGHVTLKLPSSQSFRVDARTSNGRVRTDFDARADRPSRSRRQLVATVGDDPEADLKVRTSNGSIRIVEDKD
jgi:hypothetical protein